MITASVWVPRGAAANFPTKYEIDENELARISKLAKLQLEDAESDLNHTKGQESSGLDHDDSSDAEESHGVTLPQSQGCISGRYHFCETMP